MYSVVLATMLTTGAQTTSWGLFRGCHCSGGGSCGGCAYSFCFGGGSFCGGCSSCCYRSCHGCSGGSGCCGGVTVVLGGYNGSRCSGCCYRGCHGCAGRAASGSSSGVACNGCSCSAPSGTTTAGSESGTTIPPPPSAGGPPANAPRTEAERKAVDDLLRKLRAPGREEVSVPPTKARVVVTVPAEARLWVDQVECPLPGTVRTFDTPDLNPQQNYTYTLRIAVSRNGQTVEESRRVTLVPGERTQVNFIDTVAVSTVQN